MLVTDRFGERDPLAPARWSAELEKGEFDEPFPWKIPLGLLGIVLVVIFGHLRLQASRIDELHAAIHLRLDDELGPLEARFHDRAAALDPWLSSKSIDGEAYRASELSFEAIRESGLITLRRRPPSAQGEAAIAASDELGECLGVPSASLSRVRAALEEFTPELREEIDATDHFLTLRGIQDQLDRRIDALLPELAIAGEARYLLLSEEDTEARELMLSLIDLEEGQEKLRIRLPYDGRLLTARVMLDAETRDKTPGAISLPIELPKGASDCAAASSLRDAIEGRAPIGEPAAGAPSIDEPMPEGPELSAE